MASNFKVSDPVMAKLARFPAWPAVVLPHYIVPEEVLNEKPEDAEPTDLYCVYFFNDNHFGWCTTSGLKLVTNNTLKKLKSNKADLRVAIGLMKDYLAGDRTSRFESFLRDRNLVEDSDQIEDLLAGSPFDEEDGGDEETSTFHEEENSVKENKQRKPSNTRSSSAVDRKKRAIDEEEKEVKKKLKEEETPEQKVVKVQGFRAKLQRGLLQRTGDPTSEELKQCSDVLSELEKFSSNINTELLKVSKLHKVLRAILKTESLKEPDGIQFHARAEDLLIRWSDYIHEIKIEKDQERLRTETPSSSVLESNTELSSQALQRVGNGNGTKRDALKTEPDTTSNGAAAKD